VGQSLDIRSETGAMAKAPFLSGKGGFMQSRHSILAVVLLCAAAFSSPVDRGAWSPLFPRAAREDIIHVFGAGNYLWFDTRTSFCKVNVSTGDCRVFRYDSLNIQKSILSLVAALDSNSVALYGYSASTGSEIIIDNGIESRRMSC
jgi:hypothetical protein